MIKVAIIGISGYTGLELLKILINHPKFEISYVANSEGATKTDILHNSMTKVAELNVEKMSAKDVAKIADLAFLALPHKTAMSFAKELIELGVKVVDLSADYRLELETYESVYCSHLDKDNLKDAVYGLPEFFGNSIKNAKLIANPGCYPTATLLGIAPFLDYIREDLPLFVDAKSGVSGAGKKCTDTSHFVTINENIFAYNPITHRHSFEIKEKLFKLSSKKFELIFVPHLLPITRGMLISTFVNLKDEIDEVKILKEFYKDSKFVRVKDSPVDIKSVAGTNFCDIFVKREGKGLFISSSIDNLLRGASSQAVVNANLMYGFDEDLGIPKIGYVP